jgi:hypothetical protein
MSDLTQELCDLFELNNLDFLITVSKQFNETSTTYKILLDYSECDETINDLVGTIKQKFNKLESKDTLGLYKIVFDEFNHIMSSSDQKPNTVEITKTISDNGDVIINLIETKTNTVDEIIDGENVSLSKTQTKTRTELTETDGDVIVTETITDTTTKVTEVDVDGDGDIDAIVTETITDTVTTTIEADGDVVISETDVVKKVTEIDADGDGDIDAIVTGSVSDNVTVVVEADGDVAVSETVTDNVTVVTNDVAISETVSDNVTVVVEADGDVAVSETVTETVTETDIGLDGDDNDVFIDNYRSNNDFNHITDNIKNETNGLYTGFLNFIRGERK